jgi:hypothetical protein
MTESVGLSEIQKGITGTSNEQRKKDDEWEYEEQHDPVQTDDEKNDIDHPLIKPKTKFLITKIDDNEKEDDDSEVKSDTNYQPTVNKTDALPDMDNYRNIMSLNYDRDRKPRPTLRELQVNSNIL